MAGSRVERLRARRSRERGRVLRASLVVSALLVAVLAVPIGGAPTPTADSVMQRLAAAQRMETPAERQVAPEVEAAQESLPEAVPVTEAPELFVPLGQIEIPKIGLTVPVRNGVHERILEQGVGLWPGTGDGTGNTVLSGHRTTYLAPFRDLDVLAPSDEVLMTSGGGSTQVYEVFETQIVPEAAYVDFVLAGSPEPDDRIVTMYACHPKGQRSHRIVVRARAMGSTQEVT